MKKNSIIRIVLIIFVSIFSVDSGWLDKSAIANEFPSYPKNRRQETLDVKTSGDNKGKAPSGNHASHGGGRDGDHAPRDGRPGGDAGDINLHISRVEGKTDIVRVKGYSTKDGVRQSIDKTIDLNKETLQMFFVAIGGKGEHGGDGGDGGRGSTGSKGRNATKRRSGGRGGTGGQGGDAGDASDGGPGGRGGQIKISVPADDMDLLLFADLRRDTSQLVKGGRGGDAGTPGKRGPGGYGGSGGDAYRGTEYYYTTETDSNGKQKRVRKSKSIYQRGGSTGSTGSKGRASDRTVYDGDDGKKGRLDIDVLGKEGEVIDTFTQAFDYEVMGFRLKTPHDIFEPGEEFIIIGQEGHGLGAYSVGGMQGAKQRATIRQKSSEYIKAQTDPFKHKLPPGMEPGQSFEFETNAVLHSEVRVDKLIGKNERAKITGKVEVIVHQPSLGVDYDNSSRVQTVTIQYATGIDAMESLRALAPGEGTKLHLMASNIIPHSVGPQGDAKRQIYIRLTQKIADSKPLDLADKAGNPIPIGELIPVATLSAKEQRRISFELRLPKTTESLSDAGYQVEWYQSRPDKPDAANLIQVNNVQLRVTTTYRPSKKRETILITNPQTPVKEIRELLSHSPELKENIDILNISQAGELPPLETLKSYKTVMIAGAKFENAQGANWSTQDLLTHKTWNALQRAGTNIEILNGSEAESIALFETNKAPIKDLDSLPESKGKSVTKGQLKKIVPELLKRPEGVDEERGVKFKVTRNAMFAFKPSKTHLARLATKLSKEATRRDPARNVFFFPNQVDEPKAKKTWYWWLFRKYDVGTLTVTEAPHQNAGRAHAPDSSDERMSLSDPAFWFGYVIGQEAEEILEAFVEARDLLSMKEGNEKLIESLHAALLNLIVSEQRLYRGQKRKYQKKLTGKLTLLEALARSTVAGDLLPNSVLGKQMMELLAHIEAFSIGESNWFQRKFSLVSSSGNVSRKLGGLLEVFLDHNFTNRGRLQKRSVWIHIKKRGKEIVSEIGGRKAFRAHVDKLRHHGLLASTGTTFATAEGRVLNKEQVSHIGEHNKKRAHQADFIRKTYKKSRERLLIPAKHR